MKNESTILKGDMIPVESIAFKQYKKKVERRELVYSMIVTLLALGSFIYCLTK